MKKIFWPFDWWRLNLCNQNRLLVSERRCESVYKRTAGANVTCFRKGEARKRADGLFSVADKK